MAYVHRACVERNMKTKNVALWGRFTEMTCGNQKMCLLKTVNLLNLLYFIKVGLKMCHKKFLPLCILLLKKTTIIFDLAYLGNGKRQFLIFEDFFF